MSELFNGEAKIKYSSNWIDVIASNDGKGNNFDVFYMEDENVTITVYKNGVIITDLTHANKAAKSCKVLTISNIPSPTFFIKWVMDYFGGNLRRLIDTDEDEFTNNLNAFNNNKMRFVFTVNDSTKVFSPFSAKKYLKKMSLPIKVWNPYHMARLISNKQEVKIEYVNQVGQLAELNESDREYMVRLLMDSQHFCEGMFKDGEFFVTIICHWVVKIDIPRHLIKAGGRILGSHVPRNYLNNK